MEILTSENSITLFWERTSNGNDSKEISLYIDGMLISSTLKTHITAENLTPNTKYFFQLFEGKQLIFEKAVKTDPQKKRIVITESPYFAVGDGLTVNTKAIQKAINDCTPNEKVVIPQGTFVTGALFVDSNKEIYLEDGAVLKGSTNVTDYEPKIHTRMEGIEQECYASLINIGEWNPQRTIKTHNVIIRGNGSILGGGVELCKNTIVKEKSILKEIRPDDYECEDTVPGRARGNLILSRCAENIRIDGLNLGMAPAWNLHFLYSKNVITFHCTFESFGVWNGDGWDPDSSSNCTIFDCDFHMGDDCIAIKSGKNPEGNHISIPSKNIKIFDCHSSIGHGIAMGSEVSGGIENIHAWDCQFAGSKYGFQMKTSNKRGGYIKNVLVENCLFPCVTIGTVCYNNDGEGEKNLTEIENISIRNCYFTEIAVHEGQQIETPVLKIDGEINRDFYLKSFVFENNRKEGSASLIEDKIIDFK